VGHDRALNEARGRLRLVRCRCATKTRLVEPLLHLFVYERSTGSCKVLNHAQFQSNGALLYLMKCAEMSADTLVCSAQAADISILRLAFMNRHHCSIHPRGILISNSCERRHDGSGASLNTGRAPGEERSTRRYVIGGGKTMARMPFEGELARTHARTHCTQRCVCFTRTHARHACIDTRIYFRAFCTEVVDAGFYKAR